MGLCVLSDTVEINRCTESQSQNWEFISHKSSV